MANRLKDRNQTDSSKPPYRVPSMIEIAEIPWNGLRVASTFSGCGGSSLGYRMAGFKVVWANEFVPVAQASYRANMGEGTIMDGRDIRTVKPEEILEQAGLVKGDIDLFDGSPPCQAFSTAGKREKGWGKAKTYEHGAKQCNEQLFSEYIRLLRGLMPKTFVAENVSGLVKGTAKGFFLEILSELKASGYRVKCKVLDAQWLGVPQSRQRTIFVGVREDIGLDPVHPSPLSYRYSVRDALPEVLSFRGTGKGFNHSGPDASQPSPSVTAGMQSPWNAYEVHREVVHDTKGSFGKARNISDAPSPCITIGMGSINSTHFSVNDGVIKRKFTIGEVKRLCAFPDDFVLIGTYAQQWERLGNSVPPIMMRAIAAEIRDKILIDHGSP